MGQKIDQFCEDLRLKLTNIDSGLDALKSKIKAKAQQADQDARSHLKMVQARVQQNRAKVSTAQAEMKDWVESQKTATADKIAEWKARRETSNLQNRADKAERNAAAAIDVALSAVDDAELASVEAWLAREDANSAQTKSA